MIKALDCGVCSHKVLDLKLLGVVNSSEASPYGAIALAFIRLPASGQLDWPTRICHGVHKLI